MALAGYTLLLGAERDARYPGAADLREVERETAPAAADVENARTRPHEQLCRDQPLLGQLRLVKGQVGARKIGAGILHVFVEEETVEPLVEIVVVGHVEPGKLGADRAQDRRRRDPPQIVPRRGASGHMLGQGIGLHERDQAVGIALVEGEPAVHVHLRHGETGIAGDGSERLGIGETQRHRLAAAVAIVLRPPRRINHPEASGGDLSAERLMKYRFDHGRPVHGVVGSKRLTPSRPVAKFVLRFSTRCGVIVAGRRPYARLFGR